jgi:hypothetical protein
MRKKPVKNLVQVTGTRQCTGFNRCAKFTANKGGWCTSCLKEQEAASVVLRRLLPKRPLGL